MTREQLLKDWRQTCHVKLDECLDAQIEWEAVANKTQWPSENALLPLYSAIIKTRKALNLLLNSLKHRLERPSDAEAIGDRKSVV